MKRARLLVSGKVQGVNFRFYTNEKAFQLGVKGWVRNLEDGRVEILIEGETTAVDDLIAWSRRGPSSARVEKVVTEEQPYRGDLPDFYITR